MKVDKNYYMMLKIFDIFKQLKIYDLPKIKGIVYNIFCEVSNKIDFKKEYTINKEINESIIVSLTSFPDRINTVSTTILTIMSQTIRPQIYLWLAKDEFPEGIESLPQNLKELIKEGLNIKFCEDLKPHKKYYYTMKNNKDKIVITIDDDILYPKTLVEDLIRLHEKYPKSIICTRGHSITFTQSGKVEKYNNWTENPEIEEVPNMSICPTGVGGVLYPPNSLDREVFNKKDIYELCLSADDLWLKTMSLKHSTSVVKSKTFPYCFFTINKTQQNSLSQINIGKNRNDIQMEKILKKYNKVFDNLNNIDL